MFVTLRPFFHPHNAILFLTHALRYISHLIQHFFLILPFCLGFLLKKVEEEKIKKTTNRIFALFLSDKGRKRRKKQERLPLKGLRVSILL